MIRGTDVAEHRRTEYPVDPIFVERWSPRAMSGEALAETELMSLFEAARWAPSSYNAQPWRFVYAHRGTPHWDRFFGLLVQTNQRWAAQAAVLILVASRTHFEFNDKPSRTHSFDAGAAWQSLALQGARMGLVVHGMQGFDYERARTQLNVPEAFAVQAMIAVGKPGDRGQLPAELQQREHPSDRKAISELVFEGGF